MKSTIFEAGIKTLAFKQNAETNLTFKQGVVKDFSGLDSLPGFVLVIFERRDLGGAVFSRLVNSGERFRSRFSISRRDLWKKYFAIAVNDSVLSYAFDHSIALDDGSEDFILTFQLTFRVADARKVAETREHDPLRKLRDEIARVIARNCARRKAEMFRDRFRDLERIVIDSESARLRTYAAELGFKIISIDLDKPLPDYTREVIDKREKAEAEKANFVIEQGVSRVKPETSRAAAHELNIDNIDHEYELQVQELAKRIELQTEADVFHSAQQNRKLRELQTDAVGPALSNVGEGIDLPSTLCEGFEVARETPRSVTVKTQTDDSAASEDGSDHQDRTGAGTETRRVGGSARPPQEPSLANQRIDQSVQRETWKNQAAVLIKLLDNAGADSALTAWLREELGVIEARFFSPTDTGDAVVDTRSKYQPALDPVMCSLFAPHQASRGAKILVQAFAHLAIDSENVSTLAVEFDREARRLAAKPLDNEVERGSELTFHLSVPGLEIDDPVQRLIWRGQTNSVQFGVRVPEDFNGLEVVGTVYVSQSGVPFGHTKFLLRVIELQDSIEPKNAESAKVGAWTRYQYAFISYASADRPEVLKRVQMLSRFHIDYFHDRLTLEPGEQWEQLIYENIDKSDVFFLFWSNAARNSERVMKEIRYALARKGADGLIAPEIVPVIIEGPPPVPPPAELEHIHFDDRVIYFINAGGSVS